MSDFTDEVGRTTTRWDIDVTSRYIEAYNDAYENFKATLENQKEADKNQAELFAAVCSIITTSAIMAAINSRALRSIALRAGIASLGSRNIRLINDFYVRAGGEPVVAFAFGEALDEIKDYNKELTAKLIQRTSEGVSAPSPFNRREQLKRLVQAQGLAIQEYAVSIEKDRSLSVAKREASLAKLAASPFMQGPANVLKVRPLAEKIELGLYLQLILDSDYILHHYPVGARMAPERAGGISQRPLEPNYPKSEPSSGVHSYNTVEIDRPGFKIQEAVDKLHQQIFKTPFYEKGRYLGVLQSPFGKPEELRRANEKLVLLSKWTRPTNLRDVRFEFP